MPNSNAILLVRHGKSALGFSEALDAGLSDAGREQARRLADTIDRRGPIYSSPMRRALETASPLAAKRGVAIIIARELSEIPAPRVFAARADWLAATMQTDYSKTAPEIRKWRDAAIAFIKNLEAGAVVVTHYLTINAVLGAHAGHDRVVHRRDIGYCDPITVTIGKVIPHQVREPPASRSRPVCPPDP